jgi:hypothetical protein
VVTKFSIGDFSLEFSAIFNETDEILPTKTKPKMTKFRSIKKKYITVEAANAAPSTGKIRLCMYSKSAKLAC